MMKRKVFVAVALTVCSWGIVRGTQCEVEALFVSPAVDQTIKTRLIAEIDSAEEQILIAMYAFADEQLGDAVIRAHRRGVETYVLLGNVRGGDLSERARLVDAGIPVAGADEDGLLHHKFVVIDQTTVITGSYDWSETANDLNFENVVVMECPVIAKAFVDEFIRIAKDAIGLRWDSIVPSPTVIPGDPCLECLARLNESVASEFEACPGIDATLAARLVAHRPYSLSGSCTRAQLETVLKEISLIGSHIARLLVDCLCGDLYR